MVGRSFIYREKKAGRYCTAMPFFSIQYYNNHGCVREIRRARVPVSAKGVGPWLPREKKSDRCCCQGKKKVTVRSSVMVLPSLVSQMPERATAWRSSWWSCLPCTPAGGEIAVASLVVPWSSMNQTTGRTRSRRASWLIWHWYFLPLVTEMSLWIHTGVLLALTYSYTAWHFLGRMTHKSDSMNTLIPKPSAIGWIRNTIYYEQS